MIYMSYCLLDIKYFYVLFNVKKHVLKNIITLLQLKNLI